jgi:23S rRNA pseudouridine2605 synthase
MLEPLVYLVLNKPRGVVSSASDPGGRRTVLELVRGLGLRVSSVGRLDYDTSGVLLLTNDGDFSAALQHARRSVPKVYMAKVRGIVTDESLAQWVQSIEIDGRPTRPARVRRMREEGAKTWLEIVLSEGRNRQVRRLGDAAGNPVLKLVRTSYAGITAAGLRPGQWRALTKDELVTLRRTYGVPAKIRPAALPDPQPARRRRERYAGTQTAVARDENPRRARSAGGGGSGRRRPSC